jgi:hypothetical protein
MSTAAKSISQIKTHIKEKYELSKKQLTSDKIVFNVKVSTLDKEYANVIKNIDAEFVNFQQGKNHYSIFTSSNMKEIKLDSEIKMISDNFLRQIGILTDPKYMLALKEEVTAYKLQREISELEQKQLEYLAKKTLFIASEEMVEKLANSYWF